MKAKFLKGNPKEVNEKTRNGASKSKTLESKKKETKYPGLHHTEKEAKLLKFATTHGNGGSGYYGKNK